MKAHIIDILNRHPRSVQLPNVRNSKHAMEIRGAVVMGQLVTSSHDERNWVISRLTLGLQECSPPGAGGCLT